MGVSRRAGPGGVSRRSGYHLTADVPPGFHRVPVGRTTLVLRDDLIAHASEIYDACARLGKGVAGAGNRGSGFRLSLDGLPEIFVRRARRGGLARFVVSDVYFGLRPRPIAELEVALACRAHGLPVAEPLGAAVAWIAPMLYRGAFLTRAMPGMTLWEFLTLDDDPDVRRHVIELARRSLEIAHEGGLLHPDLNLQNLFVTRVADSFATVILDLDKARWLTRPLKTHERAATFARLRRSARKLDPEGRWIDSPALDLLTASHAQARV